MKVVLLTFVLFGSALAVSWFPYRPEITSRNQWLNQTINYLTTQIDHLSTSAAHFSDRGLLCFSEPANKLIDTMNHLRIEMKQFLENAETSNETSSHVLNAQVYNAEPIYERLVTDFGRVVEEMRQLSEKNHQEHTKLLALSAAAHQMIAYDPRMPIASKLISYVKNIISPMQNSKYEDRYESKYEQPKYLEYGYDSEYEVGYRKQSYKGKGKNYSGKKQRNGSWRDDSLTELDEELSEFDKNLVAANAIMIEKAKQFYNSIEAAQRMILVLRTANDTKKADSLENAMNLAKSSAREIFKLVPIESLEAVDRIVFLEGFAIRAGMNLETLIELNSTNNTITSA